MRKYEVRFSGKVFVSAENMEDARDVAVKYLDKARNDSAFALLQPEMKTKSGTVPWSKLFWRWDVKPVKSFPKVYEDD